MSRAPSAKHKQVFFELLDVQQDQRAAALERLADGDESVVQRVQELLDAHSRAESALGSFDVPTGAEIDPYVAGTQLGPFELQRELGAGGFGRVWLAKQREPVQRLVALKLLKAGMDTREVVARFQAERQALARMEHPGIAKVYDAGATEQGRPWIAMEYVDGLPITDYADARRLDLQSRLELFAATCRAVQHAHTKGVVHRDLKPNNVLVTEVDGRPQPKVIDFGIAKAVEEPLVADSPRTMGGQWMGTPAFMSPEQLSAAADVDTRADVYSLGALLYVLLVGEPPIAGDPRSDSDWLRRMREERPPRISSRVLESARRERPGVTRASLRRELDWVVGRCLEKEPARRYDSAAVLANEIERVLTGEPVLAGPPGAGYRMSSFARRNRVSIVVTGTVFALLLFGLLFALDRERLARDAETDARQSATEARLAQADALEELQRARAVAVLTEHMLLSVKPSVARGADTQLMVAMLERAEEHILEAGDHSPETAADLARMVGGAWWELGEAERAIPHLERALELRRTALGDDHADTQDSLLTLGAHLLQLGELKRVEPLLRESYEYHAGTPLAEDEQALLSATAFAELQSSLGQHEEALQARLRIVAALRDARAPEHTEMLTARNNLAHSLKAMNRREEALEQLEAVLAVQLAVEEFGPDHPHTLMTRGSIGNVLRELERFDEARVMLTEVLAAKRRVLPAGHISLLAALNNLGQLEVSHGDKQRGEELYLEALELARDQLGEASEPVRILSLNLALVYLDLDRDQAAADLLEPAAREGRERAGDTRLTLVTEQALIEALLRLDRVEEAHELSERALEGAREHLSGTRLRVQSFAVLHGEVLVRLEHLDAAILVLGEAHAELIGLDGAAGWRGRAAEALALAFDARAEPDTAQVWRERAAADAEEAGAEEAGE